MIDDELPRGGCATSHALVILTLLSGLWGWAYHRPALLAAAIALGSVLVLLFIYPRIATRSVRGVRRMGGAAFEDDEVQVDISFENRGILPLFYPEVEDAFPPDRDSARRAPLPGWLPMRSHAATHYRASCSGKRGACPLGIFTKAVRLEGEARLVVYPQVLELPALPVFGGGLPLAGGAASGQAGVGSEVLSVREYRPGDPLRRVHWPTTARRGKLAVLELELEQAREIAIFLDLDRRTLRGLGRRSTLEHAIRIATSAASQFLRQGHRVRLVARGQAPVLVPPGNGERQLACILSELALVRPDGETPLEAVLVEAAETLLPAGSMAFVIFASADSAVDPRTAAIAALRARGCSVVAVLLDARRFLPIFKDQQRRGDEAIALSEAAFALAGEGALVYAVQTDELAQAFLVPYTARGRQYRRAGVEERS